jgi:hypothetical protein
MSARKAIVLIITLATLSLLVACGSSSPKPNPVGASKNSLNGTYVFSSTGVDTNALFLAMAGTLNANGSGGITGGTMDLIGGDILTPTPVAQPITGGTYTIGADGRGKITINTTTLNPNTNASEGVNFTFDFVLMSASHGLITEYDSNGTGSGTIDLQSAVTQSQIAGSYAFGVSGTGIGSSPAPLATAGAMTLGSTGSVTVGVEDINNDTVPSFGQIATSSIVSLGTTPGTATIASSTGSSFTFDVYPIDSTHLKLIETDGSFLMAGDAYSQATSLPTGALVYTMAGLDTSGVPMGIGGWLNTDSNGNIQTSLEDFNDGGNVNTNPVTPGGGFIPLSTGRSQLSLSSFVNGGTNDLVGTYLFAAYPFTYSGGTGVQLLEIDGGGVTSGVVYPQTSTTLASANYGFNLTATNANGEEDDIAQFLTSSSGFNGAVDLNDDDPSDGQTVQTFDKTLTGSFTNSPAVDANGRGVATSNYFDFNFYVVNSSTVIVLENDSDQVGIGTFQSQSAISTGSAAQPVALLRPMIHPHGALKKKK